MTVNSKDRGLAARSALTALALAASGLLAACGGGGGGDSTPAASDGAVTSVPAAGGATAKATGGDGAFCDAVKAQFALLSAVGDASSGDNGVRVQYFTKLKDVNAKVRAAAPTAVRKDVDTQTTASDALADARIRGDVASATSASAQVRAPETQAAGVRVSTYVKDHCGFEATGG